MSKKYIFFCDYCNYKIISDLDNLGLRELKNDTMSAKKYRCPKCGRASTLKNTKDPQSDIERNKEEARIKEENEKWIKENIEFKVKFNKKDEDE